MANKIMSETATTEAEFYEQAKSVLTDFGVPDPTVGEPGSIPIDSPGRFEVLEMNIEETTRPGQELLNTFPRRGDERIVNASYDTPLCNIFGCTLTQFLGLECSRTSEDYTDPEISLRDNPERIPEVNAYLNPLNARVEGEMEVTGENFSKPGEIMTKTAYKCKDEVDEEVEIVDESAILDMEAEHNVSSNALNETIDTVRSTISSVQPDRSQSATVRFRKEGTLDTLQSIVDIWVSGSMVADVTGTINVNYQWKGSIKNRSFDVDSRLRLPVGSINYGW